MENNQQGNNRPSGMTVAECNECETSFENTIQDESIKAFSAGYELARSYYEKRVY